MTVPAIERLSLLVDSRFIDEPHRPRLSPEEQADLRTAIARIRELEGALEPFARRNVPSSYSDDALMGWVSAGECRKARAALSQSPAMEKTDV